ncbi:MAG: CsbD family protein [Chloroflexi bacterium]|nr:CsbD family protein [Chloroflexota bacterium]
MAKSWDEIASRWTRFSREVKKKWGALTDDEVMQVNGRREILAGKIQERYGIAVEDANKQIDAWAAKLRG